LRALFEDYDFSAHLSKGFPDVGVLLSFVSCFMTLVKVASAVQSRLYGGGLAGSFLFS
jgi:hypothetical protein